MRKQDYEVSISSADNGIIVRIGCKLLVFPESQISVVMSDIGLFLREGSYGPNKLHKKYFLNECVEKGLCEANVPQPVECAQERATANAGY